MEKQFCEYHAVTCRNPEGTDCVKIPEAAKKCPYSKKDIRARASKSADEKGVAKYHIEPYILGCRTFSPTLQAINELNEKLEKIISELQ